MERALDGRLICRVIYAYNNGKSLTGGNACVRGVRVCFVASLVEVALKFFRAHVATTHQQVRAENSNISSNVKVE
jgi:hypothetical protein